MSTADWHDVYVAEVRRWPSYRRIGRPVNEAERQVAEVLAIEDFLRRRRSAKPAVRRRAKAD